ncbi:ATP-NAD kinase-like domain-containing protein [Mycena galopus ATCC 62051]|nr:ATP-NAD kinase-like domain-containing protein [Mycena galopus ATCC 62051]
MSSTASSTMSHRDLRIRAVGTQKQITLGYTDKELKITDERHSLEISYIWRKKKTNPMSLTKLVGTVDEADDKVLDAWITTLLHMAYEGVKKGRRLKKKGVSIFNKTVEPILRAAECTLDVIHTTRAGHAYDIAKTMSLDYDAIVIVSGDGLIHEVLNGFAHHEQPITAFSIPLAPVPTGTGNGLSLNLLGMDVRRLDVCAATLNIVKEARFTFGFLRGLVQFKACPIQLSYKAAESDKIKMSNTLEKRRTGNEGWTVVDEPLLYVYAGKGPYVGRDLMTFPMSLPDDGLIDIAAQPVSSRSEVLGNLGGAPKGEHYWSPSFKYVKAYAYRVKPLGSKGKSAVAVDGEVFPLEEFQVETHQALATLLSLQGHYAADPPPRPSKTST